MKWLSRFSWPARVGAVVFLVGAAVGLGATAAQARIHAGSRAAATSTPVVMDGYKCTVVATSRHRHVTGRAGSVVCGVSGNDVLKAAGSGRVVLIAGPGSDKLIASRALNSHDTMIGGTGPATMVTGTGGDDVVDTGTGNDTVDCQGDNNQGDDDSQGDESGIRMAPSTLTVVGADAGDSEDSNCSGESQDPAPFEFVGKVNTTNGTTTTPPTTMNITVLWNNDTAQTWLAANNINNNLPSVDIALTSTTHIEVEGGGSLVAGDAVEVAATASSTTLAGSTLTAVDVQAEVPGAFGFGGE